MSGLAALRAHARAIFDAGVAAADPARAVLGALRLNGEVLHVGPEGGDGEVARVDLSACRRLVVVGAGKASGLMAHAVEGLLGERIDGGLVVVKYGHGADLRRVEVMEAGHPIPDEAGRRGAEAILEILDEVGDGDLVLCCLSGGGSALLPAPVPGVSLEDKRALTKLLLASGATIDEVNAVRKHCSSTKGGQLARRAAPARVVTLVLSDVIGDRLDTIASGPFAPDETTFEDCQAILERYRLTERIPPAVVIHLKKGLDHDIPETPKAGDPCFERVFAHVVANNRTALEAAAKEAEALGYRPSILTSSLAGEAREVARVLVAVGREVREAGHPVEPPACLLAGGEPTVTVTGPGTGGRCQELALAAAVALGGIERLVLLAAGTDGTDGPTDAAGALADGQSVERASRLGLDARGALEANDAYPFFRALDDLVTTGPTLTNVMDLVCLLVGRP